jgi:phage/plasmid-like protein (TIGR03299 family)
MAANVESMFSVRQVPWHGLGQVIKDAPTSEDAMHLAGLDWEVIPMPVFTNVPQEGGGIQTIANTICNVRSDNGHPLGIVSGQYKIVQNKDAFAFTDELLGGGVTYETAGSLNFGRRVWLLAKMPSTYILEDEFVPYLVFTNGHDGKGAVKVAVTPIRVVCQNTLNLALGQAKRTWSVNHIGKMEYKMEEARKTLELTANYMGNLEASANKLVNKSIGGKELVEFIEALIPMPDEAGAQKEDNIIALRNEFFLRYDEAPDLKKFKGTQWGVINAVSDFATHTKPFRWTPTYNEKNFEKTIDGHPLLDGALKLLKVA